MDLKEIEHLAELSKLEFNEQELVEFAKDFENLINLADTIKNANIEGNRKIETKNMYELREDESKESVAVDTILKNSPQVKSGYIVVPRIME